MVPQSTKVDNNRGNVNKNSKMMVMVMKMMWTTKTIVSLEAVFWMSRNAPYILGERCVTSKDGCEGDYEDDGYD